MNSFRVEYARVDFKLIYARFTPLTDVLIVEFLQDWRGRALPPSRANLFHGHRFAHGLRELDPAWMRAKVEDYLRAMVRDRTSQAHVVPTRNARGESAMGRVVDFGLEFVELGG